MTRRGRIHRRAWTRGWGLGYIVETAPRVLWWRGDDGRELALPWRRLRDGRIGHPSAGPDDPWVTIVAPDGTARAFHLDGPPPPRTDPRQDDLPGLAVLNSRAVASAEVPPKRPPTLR